MKTVKNSQKVIERLLKIRVLRSVPHGIELSRDIERSLSKLRMKIILDVGANVGQSAIEYLDAFPGAHIHCFEPVASTYARLAQKLQNEPRVTCWKTAMGAEPTRARMSEASISSTSRIIAEPSEKSDLGVTTEEVAVQTVSLFCAEQRIGSIDLLKIDTEGFDLEVLKGAESMLASQAIGLVQVEVGLSMTNKMHVPFETIKAFMEQRGYHAFGIYGQALEWPTSEPRLRRADVVFVSNTTAAENTRSSKG